LAFHHFKKLIPQFCGIDGFSLPISFSRKLQLGFLKIVMFRVLQNWNQRSLYQNYNSILQTRTIILQQAQNRFKKSAFSLNLIFQVLFHSRKSGLFQLSLTVLFTFGSTNFFYFELKLKKPRISRFSCINSCYRA